MEARHERERRSYDYAVNADGVTMVVAPALGGRWQPMVYPVDGPVTMLPLAASKDDARAAAEQAAPSVNPARSTTGSRR